MPVQPLVNLLLFLSAFALMEGVAYITHKKVMHSWLWSLHKSHHQPRDGLFEKNDFFAFFFALPSIALIWLGVNGWAPLLWPGLGVAGNSIQPCAV